MESPGGQEKIFFSGIGGSGMSALAAFLSARGQKVVGSDRDRDQGLNIRTFETLEHSGISLVPQNGEGLDASFSRVVFSTAVESGNPDAVKARELDLARISRPELLSEIINRYRSVAVAGTSGKSTTSGWLAWSLCQLGVEPGFLGGARVRQFHTRERLGNMLPGASDILVAEACESDKTIVHYHPRMAVLLNVSRDHHDVPETQDLFRKLCDHTAEQVIVNGDDPDLAGLSAPGMLRFGSSPGVDIRAENIDLKPLSSSFEVEGVAFTVRLPGLHNVYNALAVVAVLRCFGIELPQMVEPLGSFEGVERRFEIHLNQGGRLVVDDYAHNPDKIAALMTAVSRITASACYVFQPHGYGPTRFMKEGYIDTFRTFLRKEDRLLILPIFYAGGTVARDISSLDLVTPLAQTGLKVELLGDRGLLSEREQLAGVDTVVIFGARDESLSDLARTVATYLAQI